MATPLNAIMMGLSFLRDGNLDPETDVALAITNDSCNKINDTLQDLIQYQVSVLTTYRDFS